MKISVAQTLPLLNNLTANISSHCVFARKAAREGAQLILFPEMSLSGYTRAGAADLALTLSDHRLEPLIYVAGRFQISLAAGAPLALHGKLYIAHLVIFPDGSIKYYLKRNLHKGEEAYFAEGDPGQAPIQIAGKKIWFAICSDINHPEHFAEGIRKGCDLIAAGIFYSENGIGEAHAVLSKAAAIHRIPVIMSNFSGGVWELTAGGKSASWNRQGELIAEMPVSGEYLHTNDI